MIMRVSKKSNVFQNSQEKEKVLISKIINIPSGAFFGIYLGRKERKERKMHIKI